MAADYALRLSYKAVPQFPADWHKGNFIFAPTFFLKTASNYPTRGIKLDDKCHLSLRFYLLAVFFSEYCHYCALSLAVTDGRPASNGTDSDVPACHNRAWKHR